MPAASPFTALGVSEPLRRAVAEAGYEAPTPIQEQAIPVLLAGRDLIGQAQTGTGKTAAFALPILQRLDPARPQVQALVLTPTRELAIQVAEAFHTYGKHLQRVAILPVYGGQPIYQQSQRLARGVHVVVGTPGRILDHLRRASLRLDGVRTVVLDEGDEMLRMGFIDEVEEILSAMPEKRQTALFSATMPPAIRRIASRHLREPETIHVAHAKLTLPGIEQHYLMVPPHQKLEALSRLLETQPIGAVLLFARTRTGAADLAEKLHARGYAAEAMHGDLDQRAREAVLKRLRSGKTEIVVATDVAARGLDVERISHVVNYDIPYDVETYVHRIGRTGRAGRAGAAILFVSPRERKLLREIERFTGQPIQPMKLPTQADVAARRVALFKDTIRKTLKEEDLDLYLALVEELVAEGHDVAAIAAAATRLARGGKPLDVEMGPEPAMPADSPAFARSAGGDGMVRLFVGAGRRSGVRPADIVGAIANEAGVPGKSIGAIDIHDTYTLVEVPREYAQPVLTAMAGATLRGQPAQVRLTDTAERKRPRSKPPGRSKPRPQAGWKRR